MSLPFRVSKSCQSPTRLELLLTIDTAPQNPLPQSSSIVRLEVTPFCVKAFFAYSSVTASSFDQLQPLAAQRADNKQMAGERVLKDTASVSWNGRVCVEFKEKLTLTERRQVAGLEISANRFELRKCGATYDVSALTLKPVSSREGWSH